jgi:hypothetical protein
VASRAIIRARIRVLLGSAEDDPAFPDDVLNPIIQEAVDGLVADILLQNPNYLLRPAVTLAAASATSHSYVFATQAVPITDFGGVVELRHTDQDGFELREARFEELRDAGGDFYAITGPDETPELVTAAAVDAGVPLFLRYRFWPADIAADTDAPEGIPLKFHDVVALEALFAFGLGGEQRRPPELSQRWQVRRDQLIQHVGRRSTMPRTTRLLA